MVQVFSQFGFSLFSLLLLFLVALALSAYIKIVTVLSILRVGLGFNSIPSAFVSGSLAIALAFFVMFPTLNQCFVEMKRINQQRQGAVDDSTRAAALDAALSVWKAFLSKYTEDQDKKSFALVAAKLEDTRSNKGQVETLAESWQVLAPAFIISELRSAFATGLSLFLPLLVVDLLIAYVVAAVGLTQISPGLLSFPFKIALFVMVDGWGLISTNLVNMYFR